MVSNGCSSTGSKGQTNCPIRSLNFNQEVTAAGSKVDPTIARVDLNKRHVRDLAPVSGETNGARHNKRVLLLLN